jgi:hypothetical protein
MQLNSKQIEKFKELYKGIEEFEKYTENQVVEIANGVANYYLKLYEIKVRIDKCEK